MEITWILGSSLWLTPIAKDSGGFMRASQCYAWWPPLLKTVSRQDGSRSPLASDKAVCLLPLQPRWVHRNDICCTDTPGDLLDSQVLQVLLLLASHCETHPEGEGVTDSQLMAARSGWEWNPSKNPKRQQGVKPKTESLPRCGGGAGEGFYRLLQEHHRTVARTAALPASDAWKTQ